MAARRRCPGSAGSWPAGWRGAARPRPPAPAAASACDRRRRPAPWPAGSASAACPGAAGPRHGPARP
eukprot:7391609-Alexandrium_andersonii.AAC.1